MEEVFFALLALALLAAVPAGLIALFVRTGALRREIHELKTMVKSLQQGIGAPKATMRPGPAAIQPAQEAQPAAPETAQEAPPPATSPSPQPTPPAPPPPPPAPPPTPTPGTATTHPAPDTPYTPKPSAAMAQGIAAFQLPPPPPPTALETFWRKVGDWILVRGAFAPTGTTHEFAFATSWLVRVGVVLVAASVVYFIRLSIDRGWMGPSGRVASTILVGAAGSIIGTAIAKRTRYGAIGHAVTALGVVSLYLGFGMGHRFFDPPVIYSAPLAFAALAGVSLFAGFVSVILPSPLIATMALVGGYAVPVIAGKDTGSPYSLGLYILILDAMAFAVARFRRWSALDFLSATLAYATFFAWSDRHAYSYYQGGANTLLAVTVFLTLVHAIYMIGVVVDSGKRGKAGNAIAWTGLALNACAYALFLAVHFRKGFSSEYTGLVLLALVAAYLAVAMKSRRSWRLDRATLNIILVFALGFLSIAPLLLFDKVWCTMAWSAIAVAACEAERWSGERILGVMSLIVLAAAAAAGLFWAAPNAYGLTGATPDPFPAATPGGYGVALLGRMARLWTIPAATAIIGRRSRGWLYIAACILGFLCFTAEASMFGDAFMPSFGGGTVTMSWMLLAGATIWFGIARRNRKVRIAALAIAGAAVVKLLLFDTAHLATPPRVAVFALTGALLIAGAFLYIRYRERFVTND